MNVKGFASIREDLREFHYDFWEDFLLSNVTKENEARRHEIPFVLARIESERPLWHMVYTGQWPVLHLYRHHNTVTNPVRGLGIGSSDSSINVNRSVDRPAITGCHLP